MFLWDRKFAERQRRAYRAEDSKLVPTDGQTIVDAFLRKQSSRLDPPQLSYGALRNFLESAGEVPWDDASASSTQDTPLALLDDRRDDTGWIDINGTQHAARNWDGYVDYPPQGESRVSGLLNPGDLYKKLLKSVSFISIAFHLARSILKKMTETIGWRGASCLLCCQNESSGILPDKCVDTLRI